MDNQRHIRLITSGVIVLAPVCVLVCHWALRDSGDNALPCMASLPLIILATSFGGFWPGTAATMLGLAALSFCLSGFPLSPNGVTETDAIALQLFLLVGVGISSLSAPRGRLMDMKVSVQRTEAETRTKGTQQRVRHIGIRMREIFWVTDLAEKRVIYVSPGFDQVWGRTTQSHYRKPQSWLDRIHFDDRSRVAENLEQRRHGIFNDLEFRIIDSNGSIRWIWHRAFPMRDVDGEPTRMAGLAEDVTQRKSAEAALRESEGRYRGIFENAAVGIAHVDERSVCVCANPKLTELVQYAAEQLVGVALTRVVCPDDHAATVALFGRLLSGELPSGAVESRFIRKDGRTIWCLVTASVQHAVSGDAPSCIVLVQDISEQKRIEAELCVAKAAIHDGQIRGIGTAND